MTPLLLQFISESRDLLQDISEQLLKAEKNGRQANDSYRTVPTGTHPER